MSKHTPGPWFTQHTPTYQAIKAGATVGKKGGPKTLASVYNYGPAPGADARFIAAAPELLKALEQINDWCCFATEEDTAARLMALQQIGVHARAAISLATGESPNA